MSFSKYEDGPFITYKAKTLNDLYLALLDIRSHTPELMDEEWWGFDEGSICTRKNLYIESGLSLETNDV